MNIPLNSPLAFLGLALLGIGAFMVLAGLDIIRVQQVTVRQGARTWVLGAIFAVVGFVLLYPELAESIDAMQGDGLPTPAPASVDEVMPAAPSPSSDWRSLEFQIPGDTLWGQATDGIYTVRGSADTIAWSREAFEGDLEILMDVESPEALAEFSVIVYGDGRGFSPECLIFSVANDYYGIMSGTVYEGGDFLAGELVERDLTGGRHTMGIRIRERRATLFFDGTELASAYLWDDIGTAGRIGLYKHWERPEVTFSNIQVRTLGEGE